MFKKRGILMLAVACIALNVSPLCVKAATETPIATSPTGSVHQIDSMKLRSGGYAGALNTNSDGHTFKEAWEATLYGDNCSLIYGYNTFLINEDYAHAYHFKLEHSAIVANDNGTFESSRKPAKMEVRHKGTFIQYQNTFFD